MELGKICDGTGQKLGRIRVGTWKSLLWEGFTIELRTYLPSSLEFTKKNIVGNWEDYMMWPEQELLKFELGWIGYKRSLSWIPGNGIEPAMELEGIMVEVVWYNLGEN